MLYLLIFNDARATYHLFDVQGSRCQLLWWHLIKDELFLYARCQIKDCVVCLRIFVVNKIIYEVYNEISSLPIVYKGYNPGVLHYLIAGIPHF